MEMSGDRRLSSLFEVYQLHYDAAMLTLYVIDILLRNIVEYVLANLCPFIVSECRICIFLAFVSSCVRLLIESSRKWINLEVAILQTSDFSAIYDYWANLAWLGICLQKKSKVLPWTLVSPSLKLTIALYHPFRQQRYTRSNGQS